MCPHVVLDSEDFVEQHEDVAEKEDRDLEVVRVLGDDGFEEIEGHEEREDGVDEVLGFSEAQVGVVEVDREVVAVVHSGEMVQIGLVEEIIAIQVIEYG